MLAATTISFSSSGSPRCSRRSASRRASASIPRRSQDTVAVWRHSAAVCGGLVGGDVLAVEGGVVAGVVGRCVPDALPDGGELGVLLDVKFEVGVVLGSLDVGEPVVVAVLHGDVALAPILDHEA